MNTFILSYNPFELKLSALQLSTFVKENRKLLQWYMPFTGTYVLKSYENVSSLTETFRGVFDGAPFFISQVVPSFVGGSQDQAIWTWLNTSTLPSLAAPNA